MALPIPRAELVTAATHASDLAVALMHLGAEVHLAGARDTRTVLLDEFYTLPGATPHIENVLQPRELITGISIPRSTWGGTLHLSEDPRPAVVRVRPRIRGRRARDGRPYHPERQDRRRWGGDQTVATTVEQALNGRPATADTFEAAVANAADGARPLTHNAFKPALLRRRLVRALTVLQERHAESS